MIVHRISEKDSTISRINLTLIQKGDKTRYSYVKRLNALLFDQNSHNESKHFCERCLHEYKREELLERHREECKGLLKRPTRIEIPQEGENTVHFNNYQKQMKIPYVIYADFEAWIRKIPLCKQKEGIKESFTEKTEWHEACGYTYSVVTNDGLTSIPKVYRGENAVERFLMDMMQEEKNHKRKFEHPKTAHNDTRRLGKTIMQHTDTFARNVWLRIFSWTLFKSMTIIQVVIVAKVIKDALFEGNKRNKLHWTKS